MTGAAEVRHGAAVAAAAAAAELHDHEEAEAQSCPQEGAMADVEVAALVEEGEEDDRVTFLEVAHKDRLHLPIQFPHGIGGQVGLRAASEAWKGDGRGVVVVQLLVQEVAPLAVVAERQYTCTDRIHHRRIRRESAEERVGAAGHLEARLSMFYWEVDAAAEEARAERLKEVGAEERMVSSESEQECRRPACSRQCWTP